MASASAGSLISVSGVKPFEDAATRTSFFPTVTRKTGVVPIRVFPSVLTIEEGICRPTSPCDFFNSHKIRANVPVTIAIAPIVGKNDLAAAERSEDDSFCSTAAASGERGIDD